jgi:hypothetical protein
VPDEIIHRAIGRGVESQITVVAVTREQPFTLERPADPLGDPLDERFELPRARRADAPKRWRLGASEIRGYSMLESVVQRPIHSATDSSALAATRYLCVQRGYCRFSNRSYCRA